MHWFSPEHAVPELRAVHAAVASADWSGLGAAWARLDTLDLQAAGADIVVENVASATLLAAASAGLGERLARALWCWARIREGWEIRSSARAEEVSADQWSGFREALIEAEIVLVELSAKDPADGLVATARLNTARGLGLGLSEGERRYRRVAAHHHDAVTPQSLHLQFLAPKWYGDRDRMLVFARERLAEAPPGSSAGRLVAEAHREMWVSEEDGGAAFFADPARREELLSAADSSVWHPEYGGGAFEVLDHSMFAVAHVLAGRHADAARHFTALGNRAARAAWAYYRDPEKAYAEARASSLGLVG